MYAGITLQSYYTPTHTEDPPHVEAGSLLKKSNKNLMNP